MNILDTMTVSNITYKNIVKIKADKDLYLDNNYFFYYVENVGIILPILRTIFYTR